MSNDDMWRTAEVLFPPCEKCGQVAGYENYPWGNGMLWCKNRACQNIVSPKDLAHQFNNLMLQHDLDVSTLPETDHPTRGKHGSLRQAACEHCGEDVWHDSHSGQWFHNDDDLDEHDARPDEYDEDMAERDARNEAADQLRDEWELRRGYRLADTNPYVVNDPNQSGFQNFMDTAKNYVFGPETDGAGHEVRNMAVPMAPGMAVSDGVKAVGKGLASQINPTMTGQEETPAFNPGPMKPSLETFSTPASTTSTPSSTSSGSAPMTDSTKTSTLMRMAAIEFLAEQNTSDRDELLFRAHRHAVNLTGQLSAIQSARACQLFVGAVDHELRTAGCGCNEDEPCDGCGAEAGEKCRPWCTGEAAHNNDKEDNKTKKKSHRTAFVADFPDELMF